MTKPRRPQLDTRATRRQVLWTNNSPYLLECPSLSLRSTSWPPSGPRRRPRHAPSTRCVFSTEKHAAAACQFPRCQRCLFRRRDASHGSRVGVSRLCMARSDLSTGHAGPPAGFPTRSPSPLGVDPRATVRHTWQISGREGDGFEISGRRRAPVPGADVVVSRPTDRLRSTPERHIPREPS